MDVYQYLTLKKKFWKEKVFFKNLEYCSLVESTKTENAIITNHYKIVRSKVNNKTNRMGSTNWIYRKERSFASNYFIFLKNFVSTQEPLIKSWFDVPTIQMSILILFVSFIWGLFFPVSILNISCFSMKFKKTIFFWLHWRSFQCSTEST